MLKYLFLLLLVTACSDSNTKKIVNDVSHGLNDSNNYHTYMDEVVLPKSQELIESYNKNPEEVCKTLNKLKIQELINLNDVFEIVKDKIPCAEKPMEEIRSFYNSYAYSKPSVSEFKFSIKTKVNSSALILDKAYSLPAEKQLPRKVINLTFDDGPHSENTEKVLATLKRYNLKANFFVVGRNAKARPDLVKKIATDGHSVGGHSMTHSNLSKIGFTKAKNEITGVLSVIVDILGATDPFFRFPYGARTSSLRSFLKENDVTDFFWNVDTLDWKYKNPDFLLQYALNQTTQTGRGIVLFHDIQPQTAAILPSYLEKLSEAGYETVVYEPK